MRVLRPNAFTFCILITSILIISGCSIPEFTFFNAKSRKITDNQAKSKFELQAKKTAYVQNDTALYDKPNGTRIRNDIIKGRVVTVIDEQEDWIKIVIYTYDTPADNLGWVKTDVITGTPEGLTLLEGRLKKESYLMDGPPPDGKQLPDVVNAEGQLLIEERRNGWVRAQFAGGVNGWIPENVVEFTGPDLD